MRSYAAFATRYALGSVRLDEIRRELFAQVSKVVDSGLKVTHLDGHQHLHILPGIMEIVIDACLKFSIQCVRIPEENVAGEAVRASWARGAQKHILNQMAAKARNKLAGSGLTSTGYFFGFSSGGDLNERTWRNLVSHLPVGSTEVMSHPGMQDSLLQEATGWNYHWSDELRALCNPELRDDLLKRCIRLVNYGDLV
jgi:predicted glycoside hydrolase/deacetylase ChbG (UPF0249 family)